MAAKLGNFKTRTFWQTFSLINIPNSASACTRWQGMRTGRKLLFQQNHCGIYRSDDGGENWKDIRNNLPSRFGFPIAVDANDPKRVYVIPLEGDFSRVVPGGKFSVWASDNSGREWFSLGKGLPKPAYFSVLRDAMTSDLEGPCGVYVGTTTGHLYASRNQGNSWSSRQRYVTFDPFSVGLGRGLRTAKSVG